MAFSACLTGSWDETLKVWDVPSEQTVHTFVGHNAKVGPMTVWGRHSKASEWDRWFNSKNL